ncbi:MAG TPA: hypothetical protein VGU71_22315 [Candidatus Dormibacteraeota bacterium]|nr:hypothetical protein [Candidatus Dormibacteraeota bacterium]
MAGSHRQVVFASVSATPSPSGISFAFHGASDARIAQLEQLGLEELKSLQAELTKQQPHRAHYSDRFDALLAYLESRFSEFADAVAAGDISPQEFRYRAERVLRSGYTQAYRYGVGSVDGSVSLDDTDVASIVAAFSEDADYLANFARQIEAGYVPVNPEDRALVEGKMLLSERADLYANSTRELYYRGQVSAIPDDDQIEWQLGDTEHCDPCLEAADGSPYSKDTLPGYPGEICDGLSRCGCGLEYQSQVLQQTDEEAATG